MFNHILKFYLHRRNQLKTLKRQGRTWSFTRNDGLIVGYINAMRVYAILGDEAAKDSRVQAWAGR